MTILGYTHFLIGVAVSSPAEPIAVSVIDQHLVSDHLGKPQTVELLQRHLQRLPAGTSLAAAASAINAMAQHVAGMDDAAGGPELLIDVSEFGGELAILIRRPGPMPTPSMPCATVRTVTW